MAIRVKTFRIANAADETALNEFLENKVVRHWGTEFAGDPLSGVWNVLLGYEDRRDERLDDRHNQRPERGRNEGPKRNDRDRSERDPKREPREASREKPPRPEFSLDVAPADMPLYEAIRKWRNARAKEMDVKPFTFFNNRQLELMVKSKPHTSEELRALVTEMGPEQFEKYQHELLGFIAGAASTSVAETAVAETAQA